MKHTTNGVIYARYSPGPNQTDQSIEGQVRDCMEYAKKNKINIIETYADRHLSGTESEHRDDFQRMLRDAEKKQFSVVIIWKIDRFGRNREEIAINKVHLKKHGVSVEYARENIPEGPEGIILESMLEGMAEYYSAELAQKIRRGQRESVLKGRILSPTPLYGYKKDKEMHYIIDENAAPVVQEIFQLYANGAMLKEICEHLESKGIRNPRGTTFKYNMIHNMLRNRQYIGEYRFGEYVNTDCIPPIISNELFDEVQNRINSIVKKNVIAAKAKATIRFYLSEKITCGSCQQHYQGTSGKGRNGDIHYYYRCRNKKTKNKCNSRIFKKEWLEDLVLSHTCNTVLTNSMIEQIADKVISFQEHDSSTYAIKVLENQLSECQNKLTNIMKAIEMGIFTESTKERLEELEAEKNRLVLAILKEKNKRVIFTREHVIFWLELFRNGSTKNEEFRAKIFDTFINHIIIDSDTMIIAYNLGNKAQPIPYKNIMQTVRLHDVSVD